MNPGDHIGRYKLLEKIGEGGCGVVYMADQTEPIRRRVALKLIKPGLDTKQVIARFEAERQALALMDHPNIAKVLDAGATETGRSFFVMELVRGIRITDYCDQQNLSTRQRLELFVEVCHAVQHAHQKGIIHRDIMPSNILVTSLDGVPVPKVIDFGIAKATQQSLTDKTLPDDPAGNEKDRDQYYAVHPAAGGTGQILLSTGRHEVCGLLSLAHVLTQRPIAGCARFEPKPLSPTETAANFSARSLAEPALRQFIEGNLDARFES